MREGDTSPPGVGEIPRGFPMLTINQAEAGKEGKTKVKVKLGENAQVGDPLLNEPAVVLGL